MEYGFIRGYRSLFDADETILHINYLKQELHKMLQRRYQFVQISAPVVAGYRSGYNFHVASQARPIPFSVFDNNNICEIYESICHWLHELRSNLEINENTGLLAYHTNVHWTSKRNALSAPSYETLNLCFAISEKQDLNDDFFQNIILKIFSTLQMISQRFVKQDSRGILLDPRIAFTKKRDRYEKYLVKEHGHVFRYVELPHRNSTQIDIDLLPETINWKFSGTLYSHHPVINDALPLIRCHVMSDADVLAKQVQKSNHRSLLSTRYAKKIINKELKPVYNVEVNLSFFYMLLLAKNHIAETYPNAWPDDFRKYCKRNRIFIF